jgi:hypothetical protein
MTESGGGAALAKPHRLALARAVRRLEHPSLARHLAEAAGQPIDRALVKLPRSLKARLDRVVEKAILRCLDVALKSLKPELRKPPKKRVATLLAGMSGGVGGVLGMAALPVELPVTTILMLRAIADIARAEGEDLSRVEARLACVEVFALGAGSLKTRTDVGYYASRALLARVTGDAAGFFLERGVSGATAPAISGFVTEVATRFGLVVSERAAASALPIVGAIGGAAINAAFMSYFQELAHGHFAVRRLERIYGEARVKDEYACLAEALAKTREA